MCGFEPKTTKPGLHGGTRKPVEKLLTHNPLRAVLEDDATLLDGWVDGGDRYIAAALYKGRAHSESPRDEGSLGVAGECELRGLGDIFPYDQLAGERSGKLQSANSCRCCLTIGRVLVVRNGYARNTLESQRLKGEWLCR